MDQPIPVQQEQTRPPNRDDEINLLDLLLVPLKHKKMIAGIVFAAAVLAVVVSRLLPNMYQSTAVILPNAGAQGNATLSSLVGGTMGGLLGIATGGGTASQYTILLQSRWLTEKVVERHALLQELFSKSWNATKKKWTTNTIPTPQMAYRMISASLLEVETDTASGTISISFLWRTPERAREIVQYYLEELSDILRQMVIQQTSDSIRSYADELVSTTDALLRDKIYDIIAGEIERQTSAKVEKYYGFQVLEPPLASDPDMQARPNRKVIFVVAVSMAFLFGVSLAFFLEYLSNLRKDEASARRLRAVRTLLPIDSVAGKLTRMLRRRNSPCRK